VTFPPITKFIKFIIDNAGGNLKKKRDELRTIKNPPEEFFRRVVGFKTKND
jgi:hypothetical protein